MATSYSKNIRLSNLFVYYAWGSQVSLFTDQNRSSFVSGVLLYHYSNYWYYRSLLYFGILKKKQIGKIRANQEQYTVKIMKTLRIANLAPDFIGVYKKGL